MLGAGLSGRAAQRTIVFAALYLFAAVLLLWPHDRDRADAQAQSNSQQPFQCQQLGGAANPALANGPQSRRSVLPLARSGGDRGSGTMYPCVSGVPWRFKVGNLSSSNSNEVIMTADNVYAPGYNNLYFAANGDTPTEGNDGDIFQTSFAGMTICTGNGTPVGNCRIAASNLDANANNDVLISANSAYTGAVCVPPAACGTPRSRPTTTP